MGTLRSEQVFAQVVADLQRLYDVRAARSSCATRIPATRRRAGLQAAASPHATVQHHHAHASALVTEHGRRTRRRSFSPGTAWARRRRHALGRRDIHRPAGRLAACRETAAIPPAGRRQGRPLALAQRGRLVLGSGRRVPGRRAGPHRARGLGAAASIRRSRAPRAACSTPCGDRPRRAARRASRAGADVARGASRAIRRQFPRLPVAGGRRRACANRLGAARRLAAADAAPQRRGARRRGALVAGRRDRAGGRRLRDRSGVVGRRPDGRRVPEPAPDAKLRLRGLAAAGFASCCPCNCRATTAA